MRSIFGTAQLPSFHKWGETCCESWAEEMVKFFLIEIGGMVSERLGPF